MIAAIVSGILEFAGSTFTIATALATALVVVGLAASTGKAGPKEVSYTLAMPNPSDHMFTVTVNVDGLAGDEAHLDLALPVWRPGRYVILDLAGGVVGFSAAGGSGKPLAWKKTDKSTWRVTTGGSKRVSATYKVFADEFSLRTRGLDDTHAFVDPSAVFMYSEAFRSLPVALKLELPRGWRASTGMEGKGSSFRAPDYDTFIDCPLELGTQKEYAFKVKGKPHVLAVYGDPAFDADSVTKDVAKMTEVICDFWGDVPYDRYVYLLHAAPWGGGGTEHLNSTIMGTRPENLAPGEGYRGFLGLVAHEFFHTWNVKRLRPKGIVPYDYSKENYLRELWIAEGTTSYYDELLMVRAGFATADHYLETVASAVADDRKRPGNSVQSLTEASFDAWIKFGQTGAHSYNTETDFYGKGATVSMLLDLAIRSSSSNAKSLDDLMRLMYRLFPLGGPGYDVEDFRSAASEVAGTNLSSFFTDYVYGTKPLPWEESLLLAGLKLEPSSASPRPWTGAQTRETGDRLFVTRIIDGSPASKAGLDNGDEIAVVEGRKASAREFDKAVAGKKKGEKLSLMVFRDNVLREIKLEVVDSPVPDYKLEKVNTPSASQKAIYEGWLSTPWGEGERK